MAQYIGVVQGARGEASRLGTKASGMTATVNGWNVGARVIIQHEDGRDVLYIYQTGGSNGAPHSRDVIAKITDTTI